MYKLIVLLLLLSMCISYDLYNTEYDFSNSDHTQSYVVTEPQYALRGAYWDMSMEEVKTLELKEPNVCNDKNLLYTEVNTDFCDNMSVLYYFEDDKLIQASCIKRIENFTNSEQLTEIQDKLTELYGASYYSSGEIPESISEDTVIDFQISWKNQNSRISYFVKKIDKDNAVNISVIYIKPE